MKSACVGVLSIIELKMHSETLKIAATCFGLHEAIFQLCAVCGECCLPQSGNILHTVAHILPPDFPASQQLQQDRQLQAVERSRIS